MSILGWFSKRNELPPAPTQPGELREHLTTEAVRGKIQVVKQAEQAYNLRSKINEALGVLAEDSLEVIRKS